jgi:hypothetical protein
MPGQAFLGIRINDPTPNATFAWYGDLDSRVPGLSVDLCLPHGSIRKGRSESLGRYQKVHSGLFRQMGKMEFTLLTGAGLQPVRLDQARQPA